MTERIALCTKIMALVDDYHEQPSRGTRQALRSALMDEWAPTAAPVVGARAISALPIDHEPRTGNLSPDYCKGFEDGQAALRPGEAAALMALPRFSYGSIEDDFGIERSLGFIPDSAGPIVRYADVLTALLREAEAQKSHGAAPLQPLAGGEAHD